MEALSIEDTAGWFSFFFKLPGEGERAEFYDIRSIVTLLRDYVKYTRWADSVITKENIHAAAEFYRFECIESNENIIVKVRCHDFNILHAICNVGCDPVLVEMVKKNSNVEKLIFAAVRSFIEAEGSYLKFRVTWKNDGIPSMEVQILDKPCIIEWIGGGENWILVIRTK